MYKYLLVLLISFSGNIYSQDAIVNKFKGKIQVLDGNGIELDSKSYKLLKEGYTIKTDKKSECEILFKDGTILFVSENSQIKIEKSKITKEERDYNMNFIKGKILFFINKIKAQKNIVSIKTPTAVCAVRGTDFSIITSTEISNIGLFEGLLDVQKDNEVKQLKPGTEAVVSRDIKISQRLSTIMEKERKRAEKLAKYIKQVRNKLSQREEFLDKKLNENKEKLENFFNKQKGKLKTKDKK